MKAFAQRFWNEQTGAIVSAEIMLVATILVIGSIVGLKSLRDSVVTELADVGQALSNIDQSFCYTGTCGHGGQTGGGHFQDQADYCDNNNHCPQQSKCVNVAVYASGEQS